jgi:hypothetical protein
MLHAVAGIILVAFVLGLLQIFNAELLADPSGTDQLNKIAAIVGILVGVPAGLGVAVWTQSS